MARWSRKTLKEVGPEPVLKGERRGYWGGNEVGNRLAAEGVVPESQITQEQDWGVGLGWRPVKPASRTQESLGM